MNKHMLMVFAGACSYGMLSTFVKLAYRQGYGPAQIAFSQACTGMFVLWVITLLTEKRAFRVNGRMLATGAAIGLSTYVYYASVQYIPASLAIILLMQFAWMGMLSDWIISGKTPRGRQWLCLALIVTGTLLSSGATTGRELPAGYGTGIALGLLSAVLYAIFIIANSRTGHHLPPVRKSAVMITGATIAIGLVSLPTLSTTPLPDAGILPWTAFLAIFGTIVPPVLFAKGIPKTGASLSALLMSAELPVAVMCASLLLHEEVTVLQWVGVGMMLLAMTILPKKA